MLPFVRFRAAHLSDVVHYTHRPAFCQALFLKFLSIFSNNFPNDSRTYLNKVLTGNGTQAVPGNPSELPLFFQLFYLGNKAFQHILQTPLGKDLGQVEAGAAVTLNQ